MVLVSSILVFIATFIPNYMAILVLCGAFGYILSIDIFGMAAQLWNNCYSKHVTVSYFGVREGLIHLIMLSMTITFTAIGYHFSQDVGTSHTANFEAFGFVFICMVVVIKVLGDIQGVYLFFGILRNPFYPKSIHTRHQFLVRKRHLAVASLFYHILLRYGKYIVYIILNFHSEIQCLLTCLFAMNPKGSHGAHMTSSSSSVLSLS